jgi:hypothetical protein
MTHDPQQVAASYSSTAAAACPTATLATGMRQPVWDWKAWQRRWPIIPPTTLASTARTLAQSRILLPPTAAAAAALAVGCQRDLDNGALATAHEEDKADDISLGKYSHTRKRTAAAQQQQQQQQQHCPWLKTAKHQLNQ